MTFDVYADVMVSTRDDWQHAFEVCVVCRRCKRPSLLKVTLRDRDCADKFSTSGKIMAAEGDLEPRFHIGAFLGVADLQAQEAPENLPVEIEAAFIEGAKCLAVNCPNAAGAMFRLCLDLATKGLLPGLDAEAGPDKHQRRNLAPRLKWLFDSGLLPRDLQDLSKAVKENGDDGAHDGHLSAEDAADIYDFAYALLDQMFSLPARLVMAQKRRDERRAVGPAR